MSGRKKTVYIIEDDHEILLLISSLLKKNNYDTVIDYNGNDFDVNTVAMPRPVYN
jgi:DNA-binding response OmpR family regulator